VVFCGQGVVKRMVKVVAGLLFFGGLNFAVLMNLFMGG
jgi:hypothetical protein